jgi:acetolactate synthase-1/2/3 large subunit
MPTGGEKRVQLLEAYGVDTAFGIPGTHTIELYRGLPATSIRHVTPRHEQGGGFMADGYARVTGKPAACFTVSGPGALNIATAMGQALQDSVPMLVISADNARDQRGLGEGRLHETENLQAAMAQCSRWAHTLMSPDELPRVMARAFAVFESDRPGPVHLAIPTDVITMDAGDLDTSPWTLPSRPGPDPRAVDRAAALLHAAKKPVLALGGGCVDAAEQVRELVELLDAPVTLTHNAKGVLPPDHPLLVLSSPSYEPVRALYREADVVLGIGTEFSETDYDFFFDGQFCLGGKLIRIDIDSAQLVRNARPEVAIKSDTSLALEVLLPKLKAVRRDGGERTATVNQQLAKADSPQYQRFLDCMQQALPGAAVLGDSTQPAYFAAAQYLAPGPRLFASAATGYGTLGYALPAAMGARLGLPDTPVIALIGDGGLQFTINELSSAVEAKISIAVVVWNNERYEMIAQNFETAGMSPIGCDIHTPDFLAIARAYGCEALRVKTPEELVSALAATVNFTAPTLIEVREEDFLE